MTYTKQRYKATQPSTHGIKGNEGNSPLERLRFEASHDGYDSVITIMTRLKKNVITVFTTEQLPDAFMAPEQRSQYMDSSKSKLTVREGFKFLYIPQTNVGVIPSPEGDTNILIFEDPKSVGIFEYTKTKK